MEKQKIYFIYLTIILALLSQKLKAQSEDPNLVQKFELKSGEVLYGYQIISSDEYIVLYAENAKREIVQL